jgi:CheY-like chemotaxis protein
MNYPGEEIALPDKLEILVVDDHVVVREGLKRILQENNLLD